MPAWKIEFAYYFDTHIVPDIKGLACYAVQSIERRLFNFYTGITTNQSEGLNFLFKFHQENKDLPLDVVVLSFYQLSIYFTNELIYGFGNRGTYRLRSEYREACFIDV